MILTDVVDVETGFGTDTPQPIGHMTPSHLRARHVPAGLIRPKVEAVCGFVEATGKLAMIGGLDDAAYGNTWIRTRPPQPTGM